MSGTDDPIEAALSNLRDAVGKTLRAEQLRDRLTGLGNDDALTEWLQSNIESGVPFWVAFVEVDKFKNINDEFSYQDADALLQRIGDRLRDAARDYFPSAPTPIRAHGDEFFLAGRLETAGVDQIHGALDSVRSEISMIRISVHGKPQPIRCTVSIGWAISEDVQKTKDGLVERGVRRCLELAVAYAKFDRDTVVRFVPDMKKAEMRHDRADCRSCHTKFTISIPVGGERAHELRCPNCHVEVPRPQALKPAEPPPRLLTEGTAKQRRSAPATASFATARKAPKRSKVRAERGRR
jgi:diguanylate cyclase (GGDEF)-like protein